MNITRRRALGSALVAPALSIASPAWAQEPWPSRTVRFVVPFSAGGTTDIIARVAAERLGPRLGQQVIVENKPGASGNIAAEHVARSTDGHTFMVCSIANAAINYSLYGARMPVKPEDFTAIALLIRVPNVIFVPASSPIRDLPGLIAAAKAKPGGLNYGSAGSGGSGHMAVELVKLRAGINMVHVPFRGAGPMLIEAVAGRVDAACDNMPSCLPHIREGRLRALAVTSAGRAAALPDVPTVAEAAGLRDAEATGWFGVQAPSRTPRAVVDRLGRELDEITREPSYRAKLVELGGDPPNLTEGGGTSPDSFQRFIDAEMTRWAEVVRVSGFVAD